jgi:hypothetical protein
MSSPDCKRPLGPFEVTPEEYAEIIRVGKEMEEKHEEIMRIDRMLN